MSKLSRAEQFQNAFEEYMEKQYLQSGKIRSWILNLITENTRKKTHTYKLVLPKTYLAYHLDTAVLRKDGTMEGPGPIYLPQELPTVEEFIQQTHAYFGPFYLVKYGKIYSAVCIGPSDDVANGDIGMNIHIVYCKNHQPYPTRLTREEELEMQLEDEKLRAKKLQKEYDAAIESLGHIYTQMSNMQQSYNRYLQMQADRFAKLEGVFKKMAKEAYVIGEPMDCPICMDTITEENFHITLCGHRLCAACNSNCNRCAMCRQEY